jgi:hypothetical protein
VYVLQDELLMSAALEFAIYNAQRPLLPGRLPSRSVHAPARRVARTLVCLGRQVRRGCCRTRKQPLHSLPAWLHVG